jgi:hypothetical protein
VDAQWFTIRVGGIPLEILLTKRGKSSGGGRGATMSRIVNAKPMVLGADKIEDTYKEKLERVAKYIPGEVLATYLFLNGISATAPAGHERLFWYGLGFAVCLICTPLYFHFVANPGDAVRNQQIISTTAFLIWAYGLGAGFFKEAGLYYPIAAAFAIAIFSLISAFVVPKRG